MTPSSTPPISVVIPVYNESANLKELHTRLTQTMQTVGQPYELVFVDDGSRDDSRARLKTLAAADSHVVVIGLARNFGQHAAVSAGFSQARGDIIVTLDADLQNPPEEIPKLLDALTEGYDVAAGWRKNRHDQWWRKAASRAVNHLMNRILDSDLHDYGCMLRAYRRPVVEMMLQTHDKTLFIPALASWLNARTIEVEVEHDPRRQGHSSYSILRLLRLNFDLMTSTSVFPIQAISVIGFVSASFGLMLGLYILYRRIVLGPEAEGVFTLFALSFILFGILLMVMGIKGEYMARIYSEVRQRPLYLIRDIISADPKSTGSHEKNRAYQQSAALLGHFSQSFEMTNPKPRKIILFGYHDVGYIALETMLNIPEVQVVAVVTHADDPHENIWFRSVRELAFQHHIPVYQPESVKDDTFIDQMAQWQPDLLLSANFREILPVKLLEYAHFGGANLHGSLLPKYRGRAPVNWVLVNGETETGLTLHMMEKRVDRGPIVIQQRIGIAPTDTALDLYRKICDVIPTLLPTGLARIFDPIFVPTPQDESQATKFGRRTPADGRIDWQQPAEQIYNLIRAVTRPYPGAFCNLADLSSIVPHPAAAMSTEWDQSRYLMIWSARVVESDSGAPPGTIVEWRDRHPVVQTGQDGLLLLDYEVVGDVCDG